MDKNDLILRNIYEIRSRNLNCGVWTGEGFIGIREKLGDKYLFQEFFYDGENPVGTAEPIRWLGEIPADMEMTERYPTECEICGEACEYTPWAPGEVGNSYAGRWVCAVRNPDHKPSPISRTYTPLFDLLQTYDV
jgi:hypothetical protein